MYHSRNSNSRSKAGKNLLVWGFVLILMGATAVGDVGQVGAPVEGSVRVAGVDSSGGEAVVPAGQRIRMFKCREEEDFSVHDALAMLGSMC